MSASIGSFTFLTLKGGVSIGSGMTLQEITRPNVDGISYRKVGKRGEPFQVNTVIDLLNYPTAKTRVSDYAAMQGTLVTLVEESGSTWNNVLVLNTRHVETVPIRSSVGGITANSLVLLSMVWTLRMTETT